MNPDTGHVVDISGMSKTQLKKLKREGYSDIPDTLEEVAKLELMGKEETTIGLESTGSLSRWAKKKREKKKRLAMSGKVTEEK